MGPHYNMALVIFVFFSGINCSASHTDGTSQGAMMADAASSSTGMNGESTGSKSAIDSGKSDVSSSNNPSAMPSVMSDGGDGQPSTEAGGQDAAHAADASSVECEKNNKNNTECPVCAPAADLACSASKAVNCSYPVRGENDLLNCSCTRGTWHCSLPLPE